LLLNDRKLICAIPNICDESHDSRFHIHRSQSPFTNYNSHPTAALSRYPFGNRWPCIQQGICNHSVCLSASLDMAIASAFPHFCCSLTAFAVHRSKSRLAVRVNHLSEIDRSNRHTYSIPSRPGSRKVCPLHSILLLQSNGILDLQLPQHLSVRRHLFRLLTLLDFIVRSAESAQIHLIFNKHLFHSPRRPLGIARRSLRSIRCNWSSTAKGIRHQID
jgi:hypothetical protein